MGRGRIEEGMIEVDPALVRKMRKDEHEQAALAGSQLARELADVKGLRGHAREATGVGHRQGGRIRQKWRSGWKSTLHARQRLGGEVDTST